MSGETMGKTTAVLLGLALVMPAQAYEAQDTEAEGEGGQISNLSFMAYLINV